MVVRVAGSEVAREDALALGGVRDVAGFDDVDAGAERLRGGMGR